MRIGYACLTLGVPGTRLRTCTLKNADAATLEELTRSNLAALGRMLDYNIRQGIRVFRISSDLVPFASHPGVDFPWEERFREALAALGEKARSSGTRLSMHPGQYTVINSPEPGVVDRAVLDLAYHCRLLDLLGMGPDCKIVLHVGGAYGDRAAALERFRQNFAALPEDIRRRLVIENDDRVFHIGEALELARQLGVPAVFDNLHNAINPAGDARDEQEWIAACAETWEPADGPQKIHYSQQAEGRKPGSHSDTVRAAEFAAFARRLPEEIDVMLEVKDKNLSAIKCGLVTAPKGNLRRLEEEWARYKSPVLEHAPETYRAIRALLKDKTSCPAAEFYRLVEAALEQPVEPGRAENAALHVWGYCKDHATQRERRRFETLLEQYRAGTGGLAALKRHLLRLAEVYGEPYLLESYYFLDL